ncbi:TPA: alcohol dehydrogenase catalytic domain-containing protein [Burkholderia aenigmatica]|uniref:alcohol dehydrogenase catalytic domain-containing protein n=1 Tax=Burkholderia sp. AU45251 TaxID=3059204 RepID=UPI0026534CCF|nr:alcohol dehydrogenase catalytic domain-containing protein [Burkholderia sp. AU45251]HDR9488254.1 alcohol dehydrogenase catalytic domain-containing protein [Burkholderia aenigmatica]MDN7521118.1 alcohol dehydrogenase catalytic domain-containing protein [Burkholderia sp. AU45251]HDR9520072.1 alcohol dehydrogenase catalytic domain-containing protein [Burkholderia aenigmatica]HDR9597178.1 alcohol dehydrogenase catalytic domain-containing protein [Burkholderia aenigmatica]HDR9605071.1 alcohol de
MHYSDESMLAVVCHAPQDYRLEQVKKPAPGPNEVIIKIASCGICAGDCKGWDGASRFWGDASANRQPYIKAPVIAGHEFWGHVVELGEGAAEYHNVAIGDRVIAEQIVPCGRCRYCKGGHRWMCEVHDVYGFQREVADGGMAEYMRLSARAVIHKIDGRVSMEDAAVIEPLSCSIHAVNRADIGFEDVVVIAGAGTLGLLMVQAAHLKTPKRLIVVDMVDERLSLAKQYGADIVLNPKTDDVDKIVRQHTEGYGCDVYIETTGVPAGVTQGLQIIRKMGRFVEFSVFGRDTTVDWSIIGEEKELDLRGAHLSGDCYPVAIDLLARGLITSKGIVTHTFKLSQWDEALKLANSLDSIKVLLTP